MTWHLAWHQACEADTSHGSEAEQRRKPPVVEAVEGERPRLGLGDAHSACFQQQSEAGGGIVVAPSTVTGLRRTSTRVGGAGGGGGAQLTAIRGAQPPEYRPEELPRPWNDPPKTTIRPRYLRAEFPAGRAATPAVGTHHGGLPEPVISSSGALCGRRGAVSLARAPARGGESSRCEARLRARGGSTYRDGGRRTCGAAVGWRDGAGRGGAATGAAVPRLLGCGAPSPGRRLPAGLGAG